MAFTGKYSPGWIVGGGLVLAAVIVLGFVGWWGLRGQRLAIWAEARQDCEYWADLLSEDSSQWFKHGGWQVWSYEYPPVAGGSIFDPLADRRQLMEWEQSDEKTTTGLPLSVLAGWSLVKDYEDLRAARSLLDRAIGQDVSIVTPVILEKMEKIAEERHWPGDWKSWRGSWDRDERARAVKQENRARQWVGTQEGIWRFEDNNVVRFPGEVVQAFQSKLQRIAAGSDWGGVALVSGNAKEGDAGKVMASVDLGGATLQVGVAHMALLEEDWQQRKIWTFSMLALAVLTVATGLWVMMCGVFRERKAINAQSQFIASVTHELRAPVGAVRLMADALEHGKVDEEKVGEFHRLIARESSRLSVLIENVMDLARVEKGRRVIRREEVDFPVLVREVCEMMSLQAGESKISLQADGPELMVQADPVALRQILVNLIDNAIKFSPKGGEILIKWDKGWWFRVVDQGEGVPEEMQQYIFDRFYRGEDELRRNTKGVGIGLSLVKHLVELHGGRVTVQNDSGAVFRVEFQES